MLLENPENRRGGESARISVSDMAGWKLPQSKSASSGIYKGFHSDIFPRNHRFRSLAHIQPLAFV